MLRVAFRDFAIEVTKWPSLSEARPSSPAGIAIANEDSIGRGDAYMLEMRNDDSLLPEVKAIAFLSESDFSTPTILGSEWGGVLWIGLDNHLYQVTRALNVERDTDLGSRFVHFKISHFAHQLIVLSETALIAFSEVREIKWRVDLDIVTDVEWSDQSAILTQIDGPKVTVDLETGHAREDRTP